MKKILLSTALVAATAGMAAAEVKLSGAARFGLLYNEDQAGNEVTINGRLRINIDAKFEADNGVTYGGRIRVQGNIGPNSTTDTNTTTITVDDPATPLVDESSFSTDTRQGSTLNAAQLNVEYEGIRFELGNANGAFDSAALLFAPELGYLGRSFGDPQIYDFASYSSDPYSNSPQRVGLYLAYTFDALNVKASYHQQNQQVEGGFDSYGFSADYTFGSIIVSGAYEAFDSNGPSDNWFVGAAYKIGDVGTVGVNYIDEDIVRTYTAYGNYTINGITLGAYISNNDVDAGPTLFGWGVGASYDLGGASLSGSFQDREDEGSTADLGINFSF